MEEEIIYGDVGKFLESLPHATLDRLYQSPATCLAILSGDHSSFGKPTQTVDTKKVDKEFLDRYAVNSWESVLHYLVGTSKDDEQFQVANLLEISGLIENVHNRYTITKKGFQFLLQDMHIQIWALLLKYLEITEQLEIDLVEALNFLFQLGSLEFGQDYSIESLTTSQRTMLKDLKKLGLVYQRNSSSTRFYPTRIATSLTSGSAMGLKLRSWKLQQSTTENPDEFIMIETNYRVYAYTNSPLQIAILSIFISMQTRFANMVVGILSRDSVREALNRGITADQIISYLSHHAHPEMKKSKPVLPVTVVDQIKLWEMERNRLRTTKGVLYKDFSREQEYQEVLQYADTFGYVLWHSNSEKLIVLTPDGHTNVRNWLKEMIRNQNNQ
ncbi:RNA polymerase II transcription factor B 52 kDa subunit [Boothiomyces sp. JEL0866]|nr:RNA polymerase II transcription factor B 52 kDa subunit [Boothiomyces sp. JEL0866]